MKKIVFVTSNDFKFKTANEVCTEYGVKVVQQCIDIDEIQGEDSEKILRDKITKAYQAVGEPVIVTDDSWSIPGLNGFPGAYMKSVNSWFNANDFLNVTRPLHDRRIFLEIGLGYSDGKKVKTFTRTTEGILLKEAKGSHKLSSHQVMSFKDDGGLSIAEVYEKGASSSSRDVAKIWHKFAEWLIARQ